mmetsp:Transcript_10536/g.12686  ORF Transcript_10536/g.12686 Transcript_10536/m.12686 type:complete len:212 (+) Transcript_10536:2-637(+)
MAAYLGALPTSTLLDFDLDSTKPPSYAKGFWKHKIDGGMHYAGRRWGGSYVYEAKETFKSYDVEFHISKKKAREQFVEAVPDSHKEFLESLNWVVDIKVDFEPGRLVCVHAGLLPDNAEDQISALKKRDLQAPILFENGLVYRFAAFCGRENVVSMPDELVGKSLLISGHHGFNMIGEERIIFDKSAGRPTAYKPLQALILPERKIVTCLA